MIGDIFKWIGENIESLLFIFGGLIVIEIIRTIIREKRK
jgi:hypothetical protein